MMGSDQAAQQMNGQIDTMRQSPIAQRLGQAFQQSPAFGQIQQRAQALQGKMAAQPWGGSPIGAVFSRLLGG